ncbi:hypothetical protein FKM82_026952 [Ascaphus truei]
MVMCWARGRRGSGGGGEAGVLGGGEAGVLGGGEAGVLGGGEAGVLGGGEAGVLGGGEGRGRVLGGRKRACGKHGACEWTGRVGPPYAVGPPGNCPSCPYVKKALVVVLRLGVG